MGSDVVGCHVQHRVFHIHGKYLTAREMDCQVDGDCSASGSNVGYYQVTRFHAHHGHEQGVFDQAFCLGPGNQYCWSQHHSDAIELALAQDVGQWLPLIPAFQQLV